MKILITGGTGYIGSHTVVELQKQGFDVIIIDNLSNSKIEVLNGIEKITGKRPIFENFDLCDETKLNKFFQKYTNIDAIVHFAAFKSVKESVVEPLKYYRNNLLSLINLLTAVSKYSGASKIVYSSSCTVYGQPKELPVTEQTPFQKAISPYGNTKRISEEIIHDTINVNPDKSGIKVISLRYFNPIGAHESALIGELPLSEPDNLVPYITQTAIGIREQLKIFGSDYNTPDGTCIRDYIHVVDLAKAHIIAINRLIAHKNKSDFEVFNLGTGKGSSVLEVINSFEKVSLKKLNYKITERRSGDIEQIYADTKYANEELGWKAEKTLDDMLLSAWNWEKHYRMNS